MPVYSSDSSDDIPQSSSTRMFGRERPLHTLLGGGNVADVLLWRNRNLSAAILIGFTAIWFLFEVWEYNFITLLCHISIILMLILFVWSIGADLGVVNRNPPDPRRVVVPESTFKWVFVKINKILVKFYNVSSGKDFKTFFMAIAFLWVLSGIGNYTSSLNLLFTGFLCLVTIPVLYERYEKEADYFAGKGNRDMKKLYKKIDSKFLNKIPRGPVKEKKKY